MMNLRRIRTDSILLLLTVCLIGCAGAQTTADGRRSPRGVASGSGSDITAENIFDRDQPVATMVTGDKVVGLHVSAAVQPRGTIPYDNMSLPLVSPDGRFLATLSGLPPTWKTLTAQPGAEVPFTAQIEIYALDPDSNVAPVLHASVTEPALLGRSVDETGFLIESPRENGARWIGRASWQTGEIEWLVQDDNAICAFATLGPEDMIAFSRRTLNELGFELVVRRGDSEWIIPAQENEDWLMPTFSGVGYGLFVLRLRDGAIDAIRVNAESEQGLRRITYAALARTGATIGTAYNTLATNVVIDAGPPPAKERLVMFHPGIPRVAVWEPGIGVHILNANSIAGILDREHPEYVLLAIAGGPDQNYQPDQYLMRRHLTNARDNARLIAGTQIPRATAIGAQRYILLNPLDGSIGLTVMALVPPDVIEP